MQDTKKCGEDQGHWLRWQTLGGAFRKLHGPQYASASSGTGQAPGQAAAAVPLRLHLQPVAPPSPDFTDASLRQANAWPKLSLSSCDAAARPNLTVTTTSHSRYTPLNLVLDHYFARQSHVLRVSIFHHIPVPCRSGSYEPFCMSGPPRTPWAPCFLVARDLHLFPFIEFAVPALGGCFWKLVRSLSFEAGG